MERIYTSKNFSKFCYNYFPTCEARITNPKRWYYRWIFLLFLLNQKTSTHWHAIPIYCLAWYVALSDGFTCVIRSIGGETSSTLLADRWHSFTQQRLCSCLTYCVLSTQEPGYLPVASVYSTIPYASPYSTIAISKRINLGVNGRQWPISSPHSYCWVDFYLSSFSIRTIYSSPTS